MTITISSRKATLKDAFKERVGKKLQKLDRFFEEDAEASVTVTVEKERQTVEVTVRAGGMVFRSEKTAPDMFDSLEAAVDMIVRQITSNKSKLEKRLKVNAFNDAVFAEGMAEQEFRVVRTKKVPIKPMDVEEAVLQMNLSGHEFFVFTNSASGEVNVVYKRKNGDYGLIEATAAR